MGKRIDLDSEHSCGVCTLVRDDIPSGSASVAATADSSLLWHCCLGHPSHRNLRQTLPWISIESFICESRHLGKHHRASYKWTSLSSSQGLFYLVHCDIWGPTRSV